MIVSRFRSPRHELRIALALLICLVVAVIPQSSIAAVKKTAPKNKAPAPKAATAKSAHPPPLSDQATAARWVKSLTLREQIAQLVVIPFSGFPMNPRTRDTRKFTYLMSREHVGGLILINTPKAKPNPLEVANFLNGMQKAAKIPLLVAGDFERGVSMRIEATTVFPHAMAFTAAGDAALVRKEGEIAAKEARAIGFHWILYPDADVNNNPDNPIINIRSFGENPADVSKMVSAFIEGAHASTSPRVLVTAKHFPGHGDTSTDTHLNLATIPGDRARLEQVEWPPFRAAIQSGVDSIMSAHLAVPALDAPNMPATLSPKILNGVLREEMGFKGIIVTDALQMGGIAGGFSSGEAAVRALEAGADVLMMPPDPSAAINAVLAAIKSGRLQRKRVEDSVIKLLVAKAHLGLASKKLVDTEALHDLVNSAESNAVAREVAERSVTLVRNRDSVVPLKAPQTTAFFLLAEGRTGVEGQAMALEIRKHAANANVIQVNSTMPEADLHMAIQRAADASQYVIAAFASVSTSRGSVPLGGGFPQLVQALIDTKKPVILLALGNPYLLRTFPDVAAYLTGYSTVPPAEIAASQALFGEIPIRGKLPITIPGFAKYGEGILLPASQLPNWHQ